jgi:hypothetical protein
LSDDVTLIGVDDDNISFNVPASQKKGELSNYYYPAHGKQYGGCAWEQMDLNLDTSFLLEQHSYNSILLDVPKTFNVTEASISVFYDLTPEVRILDTQSINSNLLPVGERGYHYFEVNVDLDTDLGLITYTKDLLLDGE